MAQEMTKNICVFCSSSAKIAAEYFAVAEELGREMAQRGHRLVYGGGNIGLMGRIAEEAHRHGGKIVGVIPATFVERGLAFALAEELVVTSDMRERKTVMEKRADAFVALPGGLGTLEELLEILTLKQLKLHHKPVVILNTRNYFSPLLSQFERMFAESFAHPDYRALYHVVEEVTPALNLIEDELQNSNSQNFLHAGMQRAKWDW
jgi:hypothetical protein